MSLAVFLILGVASVIFSLLMVFTKNPVHSVLYLIITFFAIAGHYILLNAQFLAAVHVIVYAGAIMVLFLYVIMMLNLNTEAEQHKSNTLKITATVAAGLLLVILVGSLKGVEQITPVAAGVEPVGTVKNLGMVLFRDFLMPFEVASLLLLAAMIGAVMLGKSDPATDTPNSDLP